MKKFLVTTFLIALSGCGLFRVLLPSAMQTSSQDFVITSDNKIQVTVQFNKAIDLTSLAIPQVFLEFENNAIAELIVTAGDVAAEAILTTDLDIGQLCTFNPDCSFTLFMHGSASDPVRSTSGERLDGDNDGVAGGTYETTFVLIG